jgi:glycerol-3-phosphate O-acyltransferase
MSTFMHSNTETISASIDSRLFGAAMATATNETKATLVATRIDSHAAELEALEDEQERLDRHPYSGPRYEAQQTRLAVRIAALNRSITQTEAHAETVPVNTTRLERLRDDLQDLETNVSRADAGQYWIEPVATETTPDDRRE